MPSTPAVTADALYTGNPLNIFKGTSGLALVRDYDPAQIDPNFTPFDSATGLFKGNLKESISSGGFGYIDLGGFDENGVENDRSVTVSSDKWWQSPDVQRNDVTDRSLSVSFTPATLFPAIDAINNLLPLSAVGVIGQAGYSVAPEGSPTLYERDIIIIGVDKKYGIVSRALWLPRCDTTKFDKESWSRKTSTMTKLQFDALFETALGRPYKVFVDGPGWRAMGGVTAIPGGATPPVATVGGSAGHATLAFAPPASPNAPFVFNVWAKQDAGPATQIDASDIAVDPSSTDSSVVLDLTGLTAGATTFQVSATGSNLSTSALSTASNSITVT